MFLRDTFYGYTANAQFLTATEFSDQRSVAVGVADDGLADILVGSCVGDDEVAREDHHGAVALALAGQIEDDGAALALAAAFAVAVVQHVGVAVAGVERDEPQAVGDEFVGEDGRVAQDLDLIDAHGGDFGEDGAAEGVRDAEGGGLEDEVDAVAGRLRVGEG